jgi:hypothetical protein
MKRFSFAASTVAAMALLSACASSAIACVRVPTSIPNSRLLTTDDTHLTVPVNAIVWFTLVEPEEDTDHPGFPWTTPTTSDRAVLAPVPRCKQTLVTSLPDKIYAFKALRPGKATLAARLVHGWPGSTKPLLEPVLNTVTVR